MEKFEGIILFILSLGAGFLGRMFGQFDDFFKSLILLMIIDYVSGILKAIRNKNVDSRVGLFGILKKVEILLVVAVAFRIDLICQAKEINIDFARDTIIFFYIINESISILENVGEVIPVPEQIKDILAQLHNQNKKGGKSKWLRN